MVRTRLEPADAGKGLRPFAISTLPPTACGGRPLGGLGSRVRASSTKQRMESGQMAKLHSCGADETAYQENDGKHRICPLLNIK